MSNDPKTPAQAVAALVAQSTQEEPPTQTSLQLLREGLSVTKLVADWLGERGVKRPPNEQDLADYQAFLTTQDYDGVNDSTPPQTVVASAPVAIESEADRNKRIRTENEAKAQAELDAKIKESNKTIAKGETPESIAIEQKKLGFRFANEALRSKTYPIADPFFGEDENGAEYFYKALILKKPTGGQIRDWLREKQVDPNIALPVYYREDGKPFPSYFIDNALDLELQSEVDKMVSDFLLPLYLSQKSE